MVALYRFQLIQFLAFEKFKYSIAFELKIRLSIFQLGLITATTYLDSVTCKAVLQP